MNSFTTIEKYAIIKVLSYIMKADGIIHPKEEKYMEKSLMFAPFRPLLENSLIFAPFRPL